MCRIFGQLKLCSTTNRWEPLTGRAGASVTLERYNTPGLEPTRVRHTPRAAPQPGALTPPGEERSLPKGRAGKPHSPPRAVPPLLPAPSTWGASAPAPVQMREPSTACSQPLPEPQHRWDQMSCTGDGRVYLSSETRMNLHHVQTLISDACICFFPIL